MKYFLLILFFFLSIKGFAKDCSSVYDKKTNIGYYCSDKRFSFAHGESGANEICMENLKVEVDSATIKRFDEERVQFSCKMTQEEINKMLQKEQEKKVLEIKRAKEKEDKERSDLIKNAKEKCMNIGFVAGTEKFGKCVLELIK